MSTGEASGDMSAAALAEAIRRLEPRVRFAGIGGDRMRAAGFRITADTRGWASMGPLEAIAKVPPLLAEMLRHALVLRARPPALVVLVDFGAFNLRLAATLRRLRYPGPILYFFPPSAWTDREAPARQVAAYATALTTFEHQRDFYRSLGLPITYFGHPLVSLVPPKAPAPPPPADGGWVALLPGSRRGEIERHLPRLLAALALLRARRPRVRAVISAAGDEAERLIRKALAAGPSDLEIVRGAPAALERADAAWIASGTAVLEAALREVPSVALYVVQPSQVAIGRRMYRGRFVTLPNLLLDRGLIPELLQDDATPERLCDELDAVLRDPSTQREGMRALRPLLGPPDALERCARFALDLASGA
jgi:lipid-A-disaccharide synthase